MKYTLSPSNYTFDAQAKTITFTGTVPAAIGNILHVANITRGVIYFQPQGGPDFTGTYTAGVLSLAASTTGHANGDSLLVIYDDGAATVPVSAASLPLPTGAATAAKQPALGTAGTPSADVLTVQGASNGQALPTAPNVTRNVGPVDANTQRFTVADDGPLMTAIGNPGDAAATSDAGSFSLIAFIKRGLGNWTTLLARIPALVGGLFPVQTTASATDPIGTGTRQYDWANGLRQGVSSTSTAAVAFPALGTSREVMFHASTRCFVRQGDSNVAAATVAAGHLVLEAGERFHVRLAAGVTHFRVIRDSADGFLSVTAVL